jgi:predicted Zn finger-like uncharacterized protein
MEFRCPACNTSYRVPVRIDQQVRCARCNHVWRIAESDFVFADDARDENEMPEAFSSPGEDDARETSEARAGDDDGMSALVERVENWTSEPSADPVADPTWPDVDQPTGDADHLGAALEPDAPGHDQPAVAAAFDAPGERPEDAHGADDELDGPSDEDAEGFDRRLADSWFSSGAEQAADPGGADGESHAAFERIMEGIEEVIAEKSGGEGADEQAGSQADDPLRALMPDERNRGLGGSLQDVPTPSGAESDDPWGGKVVRLTARGGDRAPETRAPEPSQPERDAESPSERDPSVEPMAELIDKIAAGRAEPADFTEPDDDAPADPDASEPADRERSDVGNAHFAALRADLEDAAHAANEGAAPDQHDATAESWASAGYRDEAHEAALRESLAFDTEQDAFEPADDRREPLADHVSALDERADDPAPRDESEDGWRDESEAEWRDAEERFHDEPAAMFATDARRRDDPGAEIDAPDDDALLAEYDFGEEEPAEPRPEADEPPRRGAGTLTVAAAWALFVAVLAAGAVSAVSFRDQVAQALPASAPVYAAIGYPIDPPPLIFGEVGYSWDDASANTLILTGQVKNNRAELTEIPDIQITARDEAGEVVAQESQFLGQSALPPGETYEFRVQVEVAPEKLKTVELGF